MQTLGSLSPTNFLCQEMQTAKHRSLGSFREPASSRGAQPAGQRPETIPITSGQGLAGSQVDEGGGWLYFILDRLPSEWWAACFF